ncbi:PREDICTED: uncharacterized protein LOC105555463 [Mandrillus leucophaeus]|uniref:uncharacterized protein LOC105555463 n=1 Tax=Mandrillus leucophaeus TaxID=9568 RepID=UPI0005F3D4EE|nr:PREDICTED: uncharacterized protein LOC105555463 [Mandrillus leucophaeus]
MMGQCSTCIPSHGSMENIEPRGRLCSGPNGPRSASVSQVPSLRCTEDQALPGALVSCIELCELFHMGGPPGIHWHRVQWWREHRVPCVCDGPVFHMDLITWSMEGEHP